MNEPSGVDTSLTCERTDVVSSSSRDTIDRRYVERWDEREVSVFKVVRCVEVLVSRATMIFEGSMALVGGAPTIIGSKGGGTCEAVMFAGKGGTGGE